MVKTLRAGFVMNYLVMLFIAGVMLMVDLYQDSVQDVYDQRNYDQEQVMAVNMQFYHRYLTLYAERNPAVVGQPVDAVISLPGWYSKPSQLYGYVRFGAAYTSCVGCSDVVLGDLLRISHNSNLIGVATNSASMVTKIGSNTISLPAAASIPQGAIVYANKG